MTKPHGRLIRRKEYQQWRRDPQVALFNYLLTFMVNVYAWYLLLYWFHMWNPAYWYDIFSSALHEDWRLTPNRRARQIPEPMLTAINDAVWCHYAIISKKISTPMKHLRIIWVTFACSRTGPKAVSCRDVTIELDYLRSNQSDSFPRLQFRGAEHSIVLCTINVNPRLPFELFLESISYAIYINSLWPSDVIWRQRSRSILVQVMAFAWRHQAITWTNVDLSSVRSSYIYLMAISQEIHQSSVTKISMKITHLKCY